MFLYIPPNMEGHLLSSPECGDWPSAGKGQRQGSNYRTGCPEYLRVSQGMEYSARPPSQSQRGLLVQLASNKHEKHELVN